MASIVWKKYKHGDNIPDYALKLGSHRTDGPLYVGRRGAADEVGKINIDGMKLNNLWTHDQGKILEGEILCGVLNDVKWIKYNKGDKIPVDALKAGYYHKDGDLYIGKSEDGEIGKINIKSDAINNLWCHDGGEKHCGEILCIVPEVGDIVYKFVPIYSIEGGSSGFVDQSLTMQTGLSGSSSEMVNINNISSAACIAWNEISASQNLDTNIKSYMAEAINNNNKIQCHEEVVNKIHVDLSKPCYVYQPTVIFKLSNCTDLSMRYNSIFQKCSPMKQSEYIWENPDLR